MPPPDRVGPRLAVPLATGALVVLVTGALMWRSASAWTLALDTGNVFLGQTLPAFRTWMTGRIPEWSDLLWGGFALLGDCTTAALYPLHLLAYAATLPAPVRFFDAAFALHLGIFAAGSALLLRVLGAAGWVAALGGVLAALSPFAHLCGIAFFPVLGAQAWWPWALVAAELLTRPATPVVGGAMGLGWVALAAQVLVGVPEQAIYCGVLTSAWLLTRRTSLRPSARLGRVMLLGLGAVALSAPQLLPTLAYLPVTPRAGSLANAQLASLWLAGPGPLLFAGAGEVQGVVAFLGLGALVLATAAVATRQPRALFLVVVAALAFVLAMGPQVGLYAWLQKIPPFDHFRSPVKLYAITEFSVAWGAALGVHGLWQRGGTAARGAALALAALTLVEHAMYLPAEARTFQRAVAADAIPEVLQRLANSPPVRDRQSGAPPPLVLDTGGLAGGEYARSVGALLGLSSLRAGTVALLPRNHLALLQRTRLASILGVQYGLVAISRCLDTARRLHWRVVQWTPPFCILQNPQRVQHYELVRKAQAVPSDVAMIKSVRRHPYGPVPVVAPELAVPARSRGGGVHVLSYEPGRARLVTLAIAPAFLLVRESFVPGWSVRVDGIPVTPYPAAGVYFGIPVERGRHTVELVYRAPGLRAGLVVFASWTLGTIVWMLISRRRAP